MTLSELDKAIKPNMHGAFLFFGDEDYLKLRYREKIRATVLEEGLEAFNHAEINDLSRLAGELMTLPMMAERRLIEVVDVDYTKLSKESLSELVQLFEGKNEDSVVIFYTREDEFQAGSTKKPSELYKKLSEKIEIIEFAKQTPSRLASWVGKHFAAGGCFAPPEVCHALIDRCGTDMNTLANEISKLSAYSLSHGKKEITREMLPRISSSYRESGAFDFVNAILESNTQRAFALFTDMKQKRAKPVEIAASISRVVSEMLTVKVLTMEGLSSGEIAKETKMHEYSVKLRQNAVRQKSIKELERAVKLTFETDIKLKSSRLDKYFLIEKLIIEMSGVS